VINQLAQHSQILTLVFEWQIKNCNSTWTYRNIMTTTIRMVTCPIWISTTVTIRIPDYTGIWMVYFSRYRASKYQTIQKPDKFVQFSNGKTSLEHHLYKEKFLLYLKQSSLAGKCPFQNRTFVSGFRMVC
jgi:hypothetical protein